MSGGGILKNKNEVNHDGKIIADQSTKEFREQVLKNTKLNSLLKSDTRRETVTPVAVTADNFANPEGNQTLVEAYNELSEQDKEKLKWDIKNLKDNAVIQKKIIENMGQSIDEPKTPFQAAKDDELNEYYKDDDDEFNNFSLGEPELQQDYKQDSFSLKRFEGGNDVYIQQKEDEEEEEQQQQQDDDEIQEPPEKKSFEELRKQHYHHEHLPVKPVLDDEDGEDEGVTQKPKSFEEMRKMHYHNERVIPSKLEDENEDEDEDEDEEDDEDDE